MVKNYNNINTTNNIKDNEFMSLKQGSTYNRNKNRLRKDIKPAIEGFSTQVKPEDYLSSGLFRKIYKTNNVPPPRKNKSTTPIKEGFTDEQFNSLDKITEINKESSDNDKKLKNLYTQFTNKVNEYRDEKSRISNITKNYLLRTGSSHSYHGKNVQTDDGVKGFVTDKGVFKRYPDDATYQSSVGKNNCPKAKDLVTIEQTFSNLNSSMSPMIQGSDISSMKNKVRYVRVEHSNQYLHFQELEVYSGDENIAKLTTEIQEETADENQNFNCSGTVYYGKKYVDGNSGDIASYDDLVQSDYFKLDNSGDFNCASSSFSEGNYTDEREYPPVPVSLSTSMTGDYSYSELKNTDYPGNDIQGISMTREDCETHCNDLNDCLGYNSSTSGNFCWFKRSLQNRRGDNNWNFYTKQSKRSSTSTGTVSGQSYGNGTYTISVENSQHNINSGIESGNLTLMSKQPKIGESLGGTAVSPVYYNTIQANNVATITYPVTLYFTKVIIIGYQSNSIYNPQEISVEGSTDGSTFTTIGGSNQYDASSGNLTFTATSQTELKYIKLTETGNAPNAVWSEIYTYGKEKSNGDPLPGTQKQCVCKVQSGGGIVTQSSKGWSGAGSFTIDGNKDDNQAWPNSVHTQNSKDEWVEIDLQKEEDVTRVTIYNRPDCCQDRLNGAKIKLLNEKREQVYPTIGLTDERTQEFMIRTLPRGETCGGEGANVFVNKYPSVKDNQPSYIGCFNDNSSRTMTWDGAAYMSYDDCKQKAIDNKNTFFALQDTQSDGTSACMLSNNIIKTTSLGEAIANEFTWATNTQSTSDSTYYLYLDYSGNLTLKDSANSDAIIWQTNTASNNDDGNDSYIKFKNTDYPGNDIEGKSLSRSDCRDYCDDNNECVGYNVSKSSNFCWFKKKLGTRSNTNDFNFFLKGRRTFLVIKNDGDLVLYTGTPNDGTKTKDRQKLWSSKTGDNSGMVVESWKPDKNSSNKYKTNYLLPGQRLDANKLISSNNGKRIAIMQSDGNFVVYKGKTKCVDKKDYIGGAGWTNAVYMLNNTLFKTSQGKFVNGDPVKDITPKYTKIQLGDCMQQCQSSNECNSFSFGNENSKDNFDTCYLYRNIPQSTDSNMKMLSYQPNIANPFDIGWEHAGKMGYVDENSVLHEMSDKYKSWKDEYVEYLNTDSKYNEISSGTITDTSNTSAIDQVKDLCSANSECAGFTLNTSNNSYSLKNENIYPIGNKSSNINDVNLYVRKRDVNKVDGCSADIKEISSVQWENYEKGNMYNDSIKCGLSTELDNSRLNKLEDELKDILNKISEKMKDISINNTDNNIQAQRQVLLMDKRFKELEEIKKNLETVEPHREKTDILDETLHRKDQSVLPSLFNYWFKDRRNNESDGLTDGNEGVATTSGSASEGVGCENKAACMDDLNTYNQESFTTLTTPFDDYKEDYSILALGTLGIIGTMIAFNTCSKCK